VLKTNDPNHEDQLAPTYHLSISPPDNLNEHPDQGNVLDPNPNPDAEPGLKCRDDSADALNLARFLALFKLVHNIADISAAPKLSNSIKPHTPDTCDGSDFPKRYFRLPVLDVYLGMLEGLSR
jgi:hypothetical protein